MRFNRWLLFICLQLTLAVSVNAQIQTSEPDATTQQLPPGEPILTIPVRVIEDSETATSRQALEAESRRIEIDDLIAQQGMNSATQTMAILYLTNQGRTGILRA